MGREDEAEMRQDFQLPVVRGRNFGTLSQVPSSSFRRLLQKLSFGQLFLFPWLWVFVRVAIVLLDFTWVVPCTIRAL